MSNSYYTHGSFPSTGAQATSASMRSELDLITAGFDKLPTLTGNANKFVVVNSLGTLLEVTSTLPAATVTDNAFTVQDNLDNTKTFQFQASGITTGTQRIYTMPDATTTLVGIDVTQTLTNKTINSSSIGASTASTGAFTTLSASSTVSGTGFSTYLASPPAIGGTAAAAGTFTTLSSTGNTTIGDAVADTITVNGQFVTGTILRSAQTATNTLALAAYDTDGAAYTNLITLTASTTPTLALTSTGVGTINNMSIGATTASTGAFTTLSASSTVSGTGFSTYLASPPAIGGTAAAAGAFTTLSASSTVSGTGFSTYLASPPAIGGTAAAAGAFTTLSASSTVSGTGFSTYLASPPAIGGTAAAAGSFTALNISVGGAVNNANTGTLDATGGVLRYYSRGANISTVGSHNWRLASSNGSIDTSAMTLDISGNLLLSGTSLLSGASRKGLLLNSGAGELSIVEFGVNGTLTGYVYGNSTQTQLVAVGARSLVSETNSTERMRITSAGGVSFGATGTAYGTSGQALVSAANAPPVWTTLTLENLPGAWTKKAADCATTAALTINTAQTVIDGVTISATSRVLVKDQAAPAQNGIYTGVTTTTWVRATDADTAGKLAGAAINIDAGTVNGGYLFDTDFKSTDTLGVTAMPWYRFIDTNYTVPATQGGTGQTSYAVGDLVYASTTTALSKLADVATGNALISGGVGVAPSYGKIGLTTHISGTLAVGNGGTGVTASTGSGSVVLNTNPTITDYTESVVAIGNSGTAQTLSLASGTLQTVTLTGNCTFTMPTATAGKSFVLIVSSGAGSFTGTFTSVKWPNNAAPTLTTTATRWDILTFVSNGTSWYGNFAQAYA